MDTIWRRRFAFSHLDPAPSTRKARPRRWPICKTEFIAATAAVGLAAVTPTLWAILLRSAPYYPNFRTAPFLSDEHWLQRRLTKGGVLTVDYLRNIGLHFQIGEDVNHSGDARFLETNAALNAIGTTVANNAPSCSPAGDVTQANASAIGGLLYRGVGQ